MKTYRDLVALIGLSLWLLSDAILMIVFDADAAVMNNFVWIEIFATLAILEYHNKHFCAWLLTPIKK